MRNKLEVLYEILLLCRLPKKKTHIMYGSNLPYNMSISYINLLLRNGLLEKSSDEYETSYRGHIYIQAFSMIKELLTQKGINQFIGE